MYLNTHNMETGGKDLVTKTWVSQDGTPTIEKISAQVFQ